MPEGARRPAPQFLRLRRAHDTRLVARPVLDDRRQGAGVVTLGDHPEVVAGTGLRRMGRNQIPPPSLPVAEPIAHHHTAVFGGYLHDHFGHFLLESTARLWLPATGDEIPVVWIANWTDTFGPWMHDVLDVLGVSPHRVVVTAAGPIAVDHLAIADPGFEFGAFLHPWLARRLQRVECRPAADASHVWLSRSGLRPHSGLDDDLELEERLRDEGWLVVHPEALPVREQIELLASAAHVAGIEGSAFHALALLRDFRGIVDLFTRQEHVNFELVAEQCGFAQTRHRLPGAVPREVHDGRRPDVQWGGLDIDATLRLLRSSCVAHTHTPFS